MVFTYVSKLPRKSRLFFLALCIIVILGQVYLLTSSKTTTANNNVVIPLNEERRQQQQQPLPNQIKHDDTSVLPEPTTVMKTPPPSPPPPPPPPPVKQSPLLGFGGFLSKLPRMQHNFSPEPKEYTQLREKRRNAIKQSFLHGWNGYKKYAFGHDELKPLSNRPHNPFGGWGATMIDSLSTLIVMDLHDEFLKVMPRVNKINFKVDEDISVFESIIRYLGGFISAYELSERKQDVLLQKAEKLAQELLPAFNTPSGLPHHLWNPVQNRPNNRGTLIAEVGTVQLEFMMLSQLTGNPIYGQKAQAITDFLDSMGYEHGIYIKGLYPTSMNTYEGRFNDAIATFGAMGDSAFEYFLKEYLLVDGLVPQYGRMYTQSIRSMKRYMLRQVPGYDLLLLPPYDTQHMSHRTMMDHLTCFVPGMLAMGAKTFDEPEDMEIAKGLLETCVYMYRSSKTGLSPENWAISKTETYNPLTYNKTKEQLSDLRDWWYETPSSNPLIIEKQQRENSTNGEGEPFLVKINRAKEEEEKTQYSVNYKLPKVRERPESMYFGDKRYLLRPETVESLFIMYRITGDQKYQEYGWEIYEAIEKWCKTDSAYAVIQNVDRIPKVTIPAEEDDDVEETIIEDRNNQVDSMESFLFAETFKYLYLLFSPSDIISLDKFIFNTEAHPFQRRHWNWDRILDKKRK